ncbi:uncharacterized protein LOC131036288 isoform X2 [Cryptomeria japonica]|nr:uncharacterized protein LOC131036288 isoform X2 [Cryptomeria japonica]XP_059077549.1 uncharacterized protein LOC131036288 isoform X2 [Cryptomeria japonica]
MADFKEAVEKVLLPLQLSLGLFLIMKTTPLWAVIHCTLAYLLHCFRFPYTDYKQLHGCRGKGRVFKKVMSHATTAGGVSRLKKPKDTNNHREMSAKSENGRSMKVDYLGQSYLLQRMEGDKMQVNFEMEPKDGENMPKKGGPAYYYITEKMWETVQYVAKVAPLTVFVKNHKEIWEEVVTGDIMQFDEVLDSVILDNRSVIRLDHDYFLPVNLLLVEIKLTATLNFVAMFLKTQKHIHWLIPALMTFTAAVMGFSTTLRLSIDDYIATILCRALQWVCDLLPSMMRRRVYSWGSWVQHFRPSNDLQSKIVRGDISVLVAGGAKFHSKPTIELINFPDCSRVDEICSRGGPALFRCDSNSDSSSDSVYIEWIFENAQKCLLKSGRVASKEVWESLKPGHVELKEVRLSLKADNTDIESGDGDCSTKEIKFFTSDFHEAQKSLMVDDIHTPSLDIECSKEEAIKLFIFAAYMAELQSGSLKSYDSNSKNVHVRRFMESINTYVRSGYPPLHKLYLEGVVVRQKMPKFRLF